MQNTLDLNTNINEQQKLELQSQNVNERNSHHTLKLNFLEFYRVCIQEKLQNIYKQQILEVIHLGHLFIR